MSQKPYTDQQIIEGLKSGDRKIVIYFQKRYIYHAKAALLKMKKSTSLAKDLFNDALIVLLKNIRREDFKLEYALSSYMFTIFIRLSKRNEHLYQGHESFDEHLFIEEEEPAYDRVHDSGVLNRILDGKLEQLMKNCRAILQRVWKGFAYESIARELKLSIKYVNKMKTLCRKQLMTLLMNDPLYDNLKETFPGIVPG